MLKRLESEGLIERGQRKEALLTKTGRARAERVVRKHRIIERLLTDFMGYTGYEAHERADEMGDTFDDEMIERIDAKLGHPERCPHGWPVDPDVEQAENESLAPLAALEPGTRATSVRLDDLAHPVFEAMRRLVAERLPCKRDVGEAVADIADAMLPGDLRLDLLAQHAREAARDLEHRHALTTPDVHRQPVCTPGVQCKLEGARDVVHRDEVAPL